uniref:mRNA decay activator protein ZFP36 n=1 Tax=Myotis myotis TaxID=51298 RepID=A0A7J8ATT9_MYOMY|nr:ZFP36 ring finger protein like 1 [Myotis myotis]
MTTTLVSTTIFDLSEVLCKSNKMLNYSTPSAGGCLLDRKAVGTPTGGGFSRRHSVTLPSSKFHQNQLLSSLKGEPAPALSSRDSRFRDRSFSEGGERLLPTQKQPGSGQVNSSRYKTELCRPFEENGACKYGDKCQFAHGIHELRSLTRTGPAATSSTTPRSAAPWPGPGTSPPTVPASSIALALLGFPVPLPPPLPRGCWTAPRPSPHPPS